jgi:hypothetical protein
MASIWTPIASLDAPSAGVFDFPTLTLTGFAVLQVVGSGITVTTDGSSLLLTFYVGGAEITGTAYRWGSESARSSTATGALPAASQDGSTAAAGVGLHSNDAGYTVGIAANESMSFIAFVDTPLSTALYKRVGVQSSVVNTSGETVTAHIGAHMENAGAIGGLKVAGSSALTAGKVRVMGLA